MNNKVDFGKDSIIKILLRIAPPVMFAQLIQALYNIVDSLFIGHYGKSGLTALSIVYPIQLLMIAFAVGTGVGINTAMSYNLGTGKKEVSDKYAGVGTYFIIFLYFIFSLFLYFFMPFFAKMSSHSSMVIKDVISYGRIVSVFSFGLFLESVWTKVLQAEGDMKTPMYAQILGAVTNIILDPLLIFGLFNFPKMGIAGAGYATVIGQIVAALVVLKKGRRKSPPLREYLPYIKNIIKLGIPNILMQSAYTFYIFGLNMILKTFSDSAVTALGIYYKWQTFFFIPLNAMMTCIVPVIGFNYAGKNFKRCHETLKTSILTGFLFMTVGTILFVFMPETLIEVFTKDKEVIEIGSFGFKLIGISFIPIVTSLIYPVYFQAIGEGLKSSALTVIRTVFLFVPLGYFFAKFGLKAFFLTFIVTEIITSLIGFIIFTKEKNNDKI